MKILIFLFVAIATVSFADIPTFAKASIVQADGKDLVVNSSIPDPCVFDWNEDGLKDLLIGQYGNGKVRFYPNSGTNEAPVFTSFSYVEAGGKDISVSAS